MNVALAALSVLLAVAGLLRAFLGGREAARLHDLLRDAPTDEVHEGRTRWGAPDANGMETLHLQTASRRIWIELAGADVLAVRPTRERIFEEDAMILAVGRLDEPPDEQAGETIEPVLHGAPGRPVAVTNLARRDAERWLARVLGARHTAVACAALTALALLAGALVARGACG